MLLVAALSRQSKRRQFLVCVNVFAALSAHDFAVKRLKKG